MPRIRDVLNRLKWRDNALERAVVTYLHRGAPGDRARVSGADIVAVEGGMLTIRREDGEACIPFHRIRRIELDGETLYERRAPVRPAGKG